MTGLAAPAAAARRRARLRELGAAIEALAAGIAAELASRPATAARRAA